MALSAPRSSFGFNIMDRYSKPIIRETITQTIIQDIKDQLCNDNLEIDENTYLPSVGFDDLDSIELLMEIEDTFEITIDEEKLENLHTVKEMTDYVVSRLENPTN